MADTPIQEYVTLPSWRKAYIFANMQRYEKKVIRENKFIKKESSQHRTNLCCELFGKQLLRDACYLL